jgi:hypothetical protein
MRFVLSFPALVFLVLLSAACLETVPETSDIVSAIPWPDEERAEYLLLDRDGEEKQGTGTLSVQRLDGEYELTLSFEGNGDRDESTVLVDTETLRPISVRRERTIAGESERVEGEYDEVEGVIRVVEVAGDGEERTIPRRLEEEHYYDNEASLFLWRTIDFSEEYEASYYSVLVNQGGVQRLVTLRVVEKEEVTVPAGTFDAWRVEISTADVDQVAWFSDTPERTLVQYDNSRQLFQLTSLSPSPP